MTLHDMGDVFEYTALDSYEKKKKKSNFFCVYPVQWGMLVEQWGTNCKTALSEV